MKGTMMLLLLLMFAACETQEHANAELEAVKHAKEAAARAGQHMESGAVEEFEMAACDDYVRKYEQCLDDKVPTGEQVALRGKLEEQKREWRGVAADPERRESLPGQCKEATTLASQSLARYGCSF